MSPTRPTPSTATRSGANSRSFIVRRLPLLVVGLIAMPMFPFAQAQRTAVPTAKPNLVVEVIATDYQIHTRMRYVYMRVFSDNSVEYHDPLHVDLFEPAPTRKKMSAEQLNLLKKILSESEMTNVSGEYKGGQGVDTSLRWDVTLATPNGANTFTIWNFTYGFAHGLLPGRPITEPVRRLGCAVEDIANQVRGWERHSPQCDQQNDKKQ
jgi:hypothetical protein